jgi:carbohydrate kinase (thermoresistant glucokinase family)
METKRAVVLMGVSGCGKTAVGKALSARLDWPFFDGDDYHPPSNVRKMAAGRPLDDDDRQPWLNALVRLLEDQARASRPVLLACSALKQRYRQLLRRADMQVDFVHLSGPFDVIEARLMARPGHFMKAGMLQSQFDALEPPERALHGDIRLELADLVDVLAIQLQR